MLKNERYNIAQLAEGNNFKRFIYFKVTLRDKINYDIELINSNLKLSICNNDRKNHVIYACQTIFRENQQVPPRFNSFFMTYKPELELYTYETSTIDILLECSNQEFIRINEKLESQTKDIELLLYELLEFFAYKYNLAVSGNDFLEPSELCVGSYTCYCFYKSNKTKQYETANAIICPSIGIISNNIIEKENLQSIVNNDIPTWKYFYNKAKFCYLSYKNIDCIINAAITIESYIIYLIKENNKYKEYIKESKNNLGFNSSIEFAKKEEIITEDEYNRFKNGYEKIKLNRSLIMHGAIDSPLLDRRIAQEAYKKMCNIFNDIYQ